MAGTPAEADAPPRKKPKLTYLDITGFAEAIRLALFISGVDFEDERISREEVARRREAGLLPFGQVPVLDLGDGQGLYGQSSAILRWAGRQTELYPQELQLSVDQVLEAVQDVAYKLNTWWYGAALGRHPHTGKVAGELPEDLKATAAPFFNDVLLPTRFQEMERLVAKAGGPYFCGKRLTICDLSFYTFAGPILDGGLHGGFAGGSITPASLDACPLLRELLKKVKEHPKVMEWEQAHAPGVHDYGKQQQQAPSK